MRLFPKSKVETVPKSKVEIVTGFAAPGAAAPGRISRPIYTQIVVADRPSALVQLRAFLPDEVSVDAAPSVMDIVIVKIPVLFTSRRLAAMLEPDVSAMLERTERMLEREMLARNIEFTDMDSVFVTVECPRCSEHFRHGADDDGDDDDDSGKTTQLFRAGGDGGAREAEADRSDEDLDCSDGGGGGDREAEADCSDEDLDRSDGGGGGDCDAEADRMEEADIESSFLVWNRDCDAEADRLDSGADPVPPPAMVTFTTPSTLPICSASSRPPFGLLCCSSYARGPVRT